MVGCVEDVVVLVVLVVVDLTELLDVVVVVAGADEVVVADAIDGLVGCWPEKNESVPPELAGSFAISVSFGASLKSGVFPSQLHFPGVVSSINPAGSLHPAQRSV